MTVTVSSGRRPGEAPGPDAGTDALGQPAGATPARPGRGEVGGLVALVAALAAFLCWWWWTYRDGMPLFIDEAGYLAFALDHARTLDAGGLGQFAGSLRDQGPYGPLVPGVSALALVVVDRPFAVAAATMVLGAALLVVATWLLARRFAAGAWALLAAGVVGTLPAVLSLAGVYYFAVPAAALFTLGLACLVRADGGARHGWMIASGASFALAALARTMVVGLLPAVAGVAVVMAVWPGPRRSRRLVGTLLGGIAGSAVGLTWYLGNSGPVLDYLRSDQVRTGGGNGGQAWRVPGMRDLRLFVSDMLLPTVVVLLAIAAFVLVTRWRARRRDGGDARLSPLLPLGAIVVLATLALIIASEAVGQWLPLVPAICVIAVVALARTPPSLGRTVLVAGLCILAAFHLVEASRLVAPLSRPRDVAAGPFGRLLVTDARWLLEDQLPRELDAGGRLPRRYEATRPLIDEVVAQALAVASAAGEPPVLVLPGGADPLVNTNVIDLADRQRQGEPPVVIGALALEPGFTEAELVAALDDPEHGQPNLVLATRPDRRYEDARQTYDELTSQLPSQQFVPVLERELPDGRDVTLWWRSRASSAG